MSKVLPHPLASQLFFHLANQFPILSFLCYYRLRMSFVSLLDQVLHSQSQKDNSPEDKKQTKKNKVQPRILEYTGMPTM